MRATPVPINWHGGLSIYASESFLKAVSDEYGWIGGVDELGQLRCILPYTIIRKATIRMVRFRVEPITLGHELDLVREKAFLNSAVTYFRSAGADMIIPATTNTIFRTFPDGAQVAPYGTYIIDLNQPEETLWLNFSSSHRRKVRLAMKHGVEIRSGKEYYIDTAYKLVRDTFKRSKLGFMSFKAFRCYVLSLKEYVKIFIADYQGTVEGCAVIPFSKHSAYYAYGGSIPDPVTGAMNLLHWEAMRQFRWLGVKRYDFAGVRINPEKGSKQEGLMLFKQRFGPQLAEGYMWKYPFHPLKSAIYSVAVRLQRGGDIVDHEHHRLKNG